jgi:hypothetical protein
LIELLARDRVGHDDGVSGGAGAKLLEHGAGTLLSGLRMLEPVCGPPPSVRIDRRCGRFDEFAQAHLSR